MAKKTTLKPIKLEYRAVGATDSVEYKSVMGLLNDFAMTQDSPDETNIEAEFYDSPFDILYTGKPFKLAFTLVNYALADLPALFGGVYTAASSTAQEIYQGATAAFTSEFEWKITYQKGNAGMIIYRGKTVGTLKQENKGALGYAVTITSLVAGSDTDDTADDKMYAILGDPKTGG